MLFLMPFSQDPQDTTAISSRPPVGRGSMQPGDSVAAGEPSHEDYFEALAIPHYLVGRIDKVLPVYAGISQFADQFRS